jgi:hypothetical protein
MSNRLFSEHEEIRLSSLRLGREMIPQLFRNALDEFPVVKQWTPEIIASRYGSLTCKYANDSRPVRSNMVTTYAEFFETKVDDFYTFTRQPYEEGGPFIEDFSFPNSFLKSADEIARHIFFSGPAGTGALPHSHGAALNFLVSGRKRWVMFDATAGPGRQLEREYYQKYPSSCHSRDWFSLEYPRLQQRGLVKIYEFIQEAGDVIYIPANFNHATLNETPVLGIVLELKPIN